LSLPHAQSVGLGLILGFLARVSLLRSDYRQYPTYPHGYATHLFLGAFAALLGAVVPPALIEGEWTAVTFFLMVAQQFREIRSMERDSLKAMEDNQLVTRGSDYIENISRIFEARYYIVIFVSAAASLGFEMQGIWTSLIFAFLAFAISTVLMRTKNLESAVDIELTPVRIDGRDIWVGDIFIMNLGLQESRTIIEKNAVGVIITPKNSSARFMLASPGQRQALLHDVATILGVKKDDDTPEFTPMAKLDLETGRVGIYLVPIHRDESTLIEVLSKSSILETSKGRKFLATYSK
jgi:hypothetical protein